MYLIISFRAAFMTHVVNQKHQYHLLSEVYSSAYNTSSAIECVLIFSLFQCLKKKTSSDKFYLTFILNLVSAIVLINLDSKVNKQSKIAVRTIK